MREEQAEKAEKASCTKFVTVPYQGLETIQKNSLATSKVCEAAQKDPIRAGMFREWGTIATAMKQASDIMKGWLEAGDGKQEKCQWGPFYEEGIEVATKRSCDGEIIYPQMFTEWNYCPKCGREVEEVEE